MAPGGCRMLPLVGFPHTSPQGALVALWDFGSCTQRLPASTNFAPVSLLTPRSSRGMNDSLAASSGKGIYSFFMENSLGSAPPRHCLHTAASLGSCTPAGLGELHLPKLGCFPWAGGGNHSWPGLRWRSCSVSQPGSCQQCPRSWARREGAAWEASPNLHGSAKCSSSNSE